MIHDQIKGQHISIIFDATISLGEALTAIIRFVSDDWCWYNDWLGFRCLLKVLMGRK